MLQNRTFPHKNLVDLDENNEAKYNFQMHLLMNVKITSKPSLNSKGFYA